MNDQSNLESMRNAINDMTVLLGQARALYDAIMDNCEECDKLNRLCKGPDLPRMDNVEYLGMLLSGIMRELSEKLDAIEQVAFTLS